MRPFRRLIAAIESEGAAALVTLTRIAGSSPREAGARMVVRPSGGFHGTIGGGALEWEALAAAEAALKAGRGPALRRSLALGPELAQCCGGRVEWRIETFDRRDLADLGPIAAAEERGPGSLRARLGPDGRVERAVEPDRRGDELTKTLPPHAQASARASSPQGPVPRASSPQSAFARAEDWTEPIGEDVRTVYLFGTGHVGRALALALAPLPFAVRWIDSRREAFPVYAPANVALVHALEPARELANAPDGALVVVMTHSHPLDLEIVAEALKARRFGYVGLIGSATKRARFTTQMRAAGLPDELIGRLVCPIGLPGVKGKDPAVIAASTAAQLIMESERLAAAAPEHEPETVA